MVQKTDIEFTFDEAIKAMGVTPERLEKLIDEGKIRAYREGIHTVIPRSAIVAYLRENNGLAKRAKK